MVTLALDLGTKTGWALHNSDTGEHASGTLDMRLSPAERLRLNRDNFGWERSQDPRFYRLARFLKEIVERESVRKLVFEDVQFSTYTLQTQLWSTFRAAAWAVGISHPHVAFGCLNTSTLKLVATGRGNATKKMMAAHAALKYPEMFRMLPLTKQNPKQELYLETPEGRPVDDNEVDAFHLLKYFINV